MSIAQANAQLELPSLNAARRRPRQKCDRSIALTWFARIHRVVDAAPAHQPYQFRVPNSQPKG